MYPEYHSYISLSEAAGRCSYSHDYLRLRARQGKLKAEKFGRNWVTTPAWLDEYLDVHGEYSAAGSESSTAYSEREHTLTPAAGSAGETESTESSSSQLEETKRTHVFSDHGDSTSPTPLRIVEPAPILHRVRLRIVLLGGALLEQGAKTALVILGMVALIGAAAFFVPRAEQGITREVQRAASSIKRIAEPAGFRVPANTEDTDSANGFPRGLASSDISGSSDSDTRSEEPELPEDGNNVLPDKQPTTEGARMDGYFVHPEDTGGESSGLIIERGEPR